MTPLPFQCKKTTFFFRYIMMENLFTTSMDMMRTMLAGCGIFAVHDTGASKTCMPFNIMATFITEHLRIFLLEQSCWCGTMTNILNTWEFPWRYVKLFILLQLVRIRSHLKAGTCSLGSLSCNVERIVSQRKNSTVRGFTNSERIFKFG